MTIKKLTQTDAERLRGEIFHMILFSLAWVLIAEYMLHFRDYALGALVILVVVVTLALFSIRLYDLEENLAVTGESETIASGRYRARKNDRLYALILIFEGIAVLVTWTILLNRGKDVWVIPAFAAIAGLHFFPLAKVIGLRSYYGLGIWICLLAAAGYLLMQNGTLDAETGNAVIAYGCALGSAVDGLAIMGRIRLELKKQIGKDHP